MSNFSQAINIPGMPHHQHHHHTIVSSTMENEFTSPISVSSPFSNASSVVQTQAGMNMFGSSSASSSSSSYSSMAGGVNAISPPTSDEFDLSSLTNTTINEDKVSTFATSPIINDATTSTSIKEEDLSVKKLKPHKCEICGSCFARKVHLQRHSLRHQNGKPYCCDLCGKCFSRQDSLVRHHRLLHDNIPIEGSNGKLGSSNNGPSSSKGSAKGSPSKVSVKQVNKKKSTMKKAKKSSSIPNACVRCNSIAVPCDGKQPCSRCIQSHEQEDGGASCLYAPSSAPITIGQAFAAEVSKRSIVRQRNDSIATSTSSMTSMVEDDESSTTVSESPSWTTVNGAGFCHGPRRDTSSSVGSTTLGLGDMSFNNEWSSFQPSSTFNHPHSQIHPHPFELPQLVDSTFQTNTNFMAGESNGFDMKQMMNSHQLLSLLPNQQQFPPQFQQQQQAQPNALFDWCSFVLSQQQAQHPWVSESASNKDLNETLLGGELHMAALSQDNNEFTQIQNNASMNMNMNSWDGLMRSLSTSSSSSNVPNLPSASQYGQFTPSGQIPNHIQYHLAQSNNEILMA